MKKLLRNMLFMTLATFKVATINAQWEDLQAPALTSPDGYSYYKMAVSANNKNLVMHGMKLVISPFSMGGKYVVSTDYGASWQEFPAPFSTPIQMFWEGDKLYVQEGADTLKVSNDYGASFATQNSNFFTSSVSTPVLMINSSNWLAIKSSELYKSSDQGVTWINSGAVSVSAGPNFFETNVANNGYIVSTSVVGASYSTDNGLTWTAGNFPTGLTVSNKNSLTKADNGDFMLLEWAQKKLFKSTDHGVNWELVSGNLPTNADRCAYAGNELICICTDASTHISTDGGINFSQLTAADELMPNQMGGFFLEETDGYIYTGGANKAYRYGTGTSGLSENTFMASSILYPNPSNAQLTLAQLPFNAEISVFDATGKQVFECKNLEKQLLSVDTRNWGEGLYIVSVLTENNGQHLKLNVVH